MAIPILFLADSHLGLDLPGRPRGERRHRGEDFFDAFEAALAPAWRGETDLVIHGGDLFYRSQIPAWLASRVFARLTALADTGVDVFWVAGNHERSGVPRGLLLGHPRIRVFDRPRTFVVRRQGLDLALVGFPFAPRARADFASLLAATGHRDVAAEVRLLCLHQAVEGATVGPADFTFREGADVVRGADLPTGFAAVLSGHIHRAQTLTHDLAGRPLAAPVLYPGSTERTSFAERNETKGALWLAVEADGSVRGQLSWQFRPLAARPLAEIDLDPRGDAVSVSLRLAEALARLDPQSVVRIRLRGEASPEALPALRAEALRRAAPASMHVTVAWPRSRLNAGEPETERLSPQRTQTTQR